MVDFTFAALLFRNRQKQNIPIKAIAPHTESDRTASEDADFNPRSRTEYDETPMNRCFYATCFHSHSYAETTTGQYAFLNPLRGTQR